MTRPSRGTRPTCREPRSLLEHPRGRFPPFGLGDSDNAPASTSPTPCDADYRWPWIRGPGDRVKDARSLVGCATFPSSATPVHPFVTGWTGVGSGVIPHPRRKPIETPVRRPLREEEPSPEDQGAFHRLQPAGTRESLHAPVPGRSPLTPPLRKGHCEAPPPPFPMGSTSLGFLCLGWGERAPFRPTRAASP